MFYKLYNLCYSLKYCSSFNHFSIKINSMRTFSVRMTRKQWSGKTDWSSMCGCLQITWFITWFQLWLYWNTIIAVALKGVGISDSGLERSAKVRCYSITVLLKKILVRRNELTRIYKQLSIPSKKDVLCSNGVQTMLPTAWLKIEFCF